MTVAEFRDMDKSGWDLNEWERQAKQLKMAAIASDKNYPSTDRAKAKASFYDWCCFVWVVDAAKYAKRFAKEYGRTLDEKELTDIGLLNKAKWRNEQPKTLTEALEKAERAFRIYGASHDTGRPKAMTNRLQRLRVETKRRKETGEIRDFPDLP